MCENEEHSCKYPRANYTVGTYCKNIMNLFDAANNGNLEYVMLLVVQGADQDKSFGGRQETALTAAAENGHLDIIRSLVEQGADMEKADFFGWTPLSNAACYGHLEVVRYLLEQGANRDKAEFEGWTPLHGAAINGHLEIAKLLMIYGADLSARNNRGQLSIDRAQTEEIEQAIRDEPRRRMDEAPGKRATEQDRHPNVAAASVSTQQEDEDKDGKPISTRLDEGANEVEGEVAEEDEPSEPSDEDDSN